MSPISTRSSTLLRAAAVLAGALAAGPLLPAPAQAQAWPARQPIKLVVVFPPGGSVDQVARILAPPLAQQLRQSIVVDNRGGASGAIGTGSVAAAPADGYTFAVVFDTHAVNPALMPNLPFDARKDLAAVALVGTSPMVLATHADSPYRSFDDVVAAARAKGGSVSYGSIGSGSLGHLAVTLLAKGGRLELVHVPYRGGGPLMNDAIAGHVPLSIASVFLTKPHIESRRLRGLAVTTPQRSPSLPDVPTVAESGFAGFEAPAWWAILAPAGTPPEIVKRMNQEINLALKTPEVAQKLAQQGIDVKAGPPEAAQAFIENQMDVWARVVKEHQIRSGE
jgi:tripartite-type tricarboxylate transporter receptor subunit TctC